MSITTFVSNIFAEHKKSLVVIIFLLVIIFSIIASRIHAAALLRQDTDNQSIPLVRLIKLQQGPIDEEVILPGTVQAWHEAPIYARTNGYLKEWNTDIGTHVKTGDLLATIESPEIDAQLRQARADLETAIANNKIAQTTATRWKALVKPDFVSKQDADEKVSDAIAKQTAVASAQANVERLQELESFERVLAPFDGVITVRNTDKGALINAGSSNVGQELFRIAQIEKLRVYVQIPQSYILGIKPNLTAELHFVEYPNRTFPATLLQTAHALDPTVRTLLAEFTLNNTTGELTPGSYTEVHLKIPADFHSVHIPVNTLIFRSKGLQIATVDPHNRIVLKAIKVGLDFGNEVEVTSGITSGDSIVINPPDSLEDGDNVRIAEPLTK